MALYTQFDEGGACLQVATNQGWSEFGDWIETQTSAPLALSLWTQGYCEDLAGLRAEMETLLREAPPKNKDVASILDQLIYNIDAAGPAEIILVTNGLSADGLSPNESAIKENLPPPKTGTSAPDRIAESLRVTPEFIAPAASVIDELIALAQKGPLTPDELNQAAQSILEKMPALALKTDVTGVAAALETALTQTVEQAVA